MMKTTTTATMKGDVRSPSVKRLDGTREEARFKNRSGAKGKEEDGRV